MMPVRSGHDRSRLGVCLPCPGWSFLQMVLLACSLSPPGPLPPLHASPLLLAVFSVLFSVPWSPLLCTREVREKGTVTEMRLTEKAGPAGNSPRQLSVHCGGSEDLRPGVSSPGHPGSREESTQWELRGK